MTGARTALPPSVGRLVREVTAVVAGAGRGRVRGQPAGPRPRDREGRRGRRRSSPRRSSTRSARTAATSSGWRGSSGRSARRPRRRPDVSSPRAEVETVDRRRSRSRRRRRSRPRVDWPGWCGPARPRTPPSRRSPPTPIATRRSSRRGEARVPVRRSSCDARRRRARPRRRCRDRVRRPDMRHRGRSAGATTATDGDGSRPSSRPPGRSSTGRGGGSGGAAQGSAWRRPRPGQDRRATSSGPTAPTPAMIGPERRRGDPRDRAAVAELRRRMLEALRATVGRLADRRTEVAAALRGAPDRVARARPRLGDRGPQRPGKVDKPGRLPRPSPSRSWRY